VSKALVSKAFGPLKRFSINQEEVDMQDHPALVLNADFRPLSYFPLSLLSWQDTITAVFKEHVSVVAEYDKWGAAHRSR